MAENISLSDLTDVAQTSTASPEDYVVAYSDYVAYVAS